MNGAEDSLLCSGLELGGTSFFGTRETSIIWNIGNLRAQTSLFEATLRSDKQVYTMRRPFAYASGNVPHKRKYIKNDIRCVEPSSDHMNNWNLRGQAPLFGAKLRSYKQASPSIGYTLNLFIPLLHSVASLCGAVNSSCQ